MAHPRMSYTPVLLLQLLLAAAALFWPADTARIAYGESDGVAWRGAAAQALASHKQAERRGVGAGSVRG